jgi:RNA polymerase sigma factor (sigma-70 family)
MNNDNINMIPWESIQKLAHGAASRYWKLDINDDLVSEATLAMAEYCAEHGDPGRLRLMRVAKDACFAYVNIKSLPVTVPNHSTTRAILNGNVKAIADSDMDEDSIRWLALVLGASAAPLDNFVDVLETNEDLTDAIAVDEIWDVASNVLEPEHFDIFYRYYHEGEGQSSIAESLGVSQAAVSQMLSKSASEIKKGL